MKFSLATAALLAVAVTIARSAPVDQVKSDVADIDAAVTKLNQQLASDNPSYFDALAIDSASKDLDKKIQTATSDAQQVDGTVSDSDAQDIINSLTGTEQKTQTSADRLVKLEPKFKSLGVAGTAKGDIADIQSDVKSFGDVLVSKAPSAEQDQAQSLANSFNSDLARAAAAYTSD